MFSKPQAARDNAGGASLRRRFPRIPPLRSVASLDMTVACAGAVLAGGGLGAAIILLLRSQAQLALLLLAALISLAVAAGIHGAKTARRIFELNRRLLDYDGYKLFIDHAVEGFFRTDAAGRFLEVNPALAHICGHETPEAFRAAVREDPDGLYCEAGRRGEFSRQICTQGSVKDFISKIRRPDGKAIWVAENARAVHDPFGKFLYYEGTFQDITAQREALHAMRRALQEAQDVARAKSAFIAAMSHELKTPLNAVIGFSELMKQQLFGPVHERYRSYLDDIHSNGKRLLSLIGDVLDFARVEGGALALTESVFALDKLIRETLAAATQLRKDPPAVAVKIAPGLPFMRGDEKRIAQVLANLFSNAVKFTEAGGRVDVKAYQGPEGTLLIEIADTGIGMESGRISLALEPFRQIDDRLARRFEGMGLGLPLAKALVELHGGRLAIVSTPGKGTTVNLAFPQERATNVGSAAPMGARAELRATT